MFKIRLKVIYIIMVIIWTGYSVHALGYNRWHTIIHILRCFFINRPALKIIEYKLEQERERESEKVLAISDNCLFNKFTSQNTSRLSLTRYL